MRLSIYIKQAWRMMLANRLFSAIYICGTALAIATTTLFALIYYVKVAPIYPEFNRMKTYGAARGSLVRMLLAENLLLATTGCLIGFLLYWQYAIHNGLAFGDKVNLEQNVVNNWIGCFGEHYMVVSLIVYGLIAVCVIVGTLIPAVAVSGVQIVEAIRSRE